MRLDLIAVGTKPPKWVREGYNEYAERLGRGWRLSLTEVAAARSNNAAQVAEREADGLLRAVKDGVPCIAFDERGEALSTRQWAEHFDIWSHHGGRAALLIGGAGGLAPAVLQRADRRWSLSPLTLPHMLVRVLVAEQVYRAWTLLSGHPYHRG
ncbi:LSU m3Psi1915 methyltransferase RlmH [Halorhodospira halochloris]|uniref:Ribosomal RNA large subunit methyltransferase H n=1 Tax=Halorhodospira halochloris TaxID=1052 RepID=A0A0X8XAQ0_HALHR|nr:23S rRNA (pseudouridine(1915)-N(3))-methyltransferase RlmH [Halorhodospira halochloris]MBK1651696.1 23S rRNA (pseudouridine(1915)-N(3))-methyltransferase RlmH [Halorhodospira halochloris]BAU58559.1 LSU m3Psi1915 methyltransferase RlmH [Halorhodospira halochloris]